MAKIPFYKDFCIRCGTEIFDVFWIYRWKGLKGYCCESCGDIIHQQGYQLLNTAVKLLTKQGIDVVENKEKFGYFQLVALICNKKQDEFITNLLTKYRKEYPEFEWDWRWF